MDFVMSRILSLTLSLLSVCATSAHAGIVTFGSGANSFNMEFVTIGDAGNVADTTGSPNPAGAVSYEYQMGKYEVSEAMIDAYNAEFGTANSLVITKDTRGVDKPATSVSWNEAARFVNWLNTSQGFQAAYKFTTGGVNDNIALWSSAEAWQLGGENLYRHKDAHYWLPSMDEWYKAAYYDPNKNSGLGGYWDYGTGSDTLPTAVVSGTGSNEAVYNQPIATGPADIDRAGGLSAFGVMGMSGNVYEWEETTGDLTNSSGSSGRVIRGGWWASGRLGGALSSLARAPIVGTNNAGGSDLYIGFRVASLSSSAAVPEPGSLAIIGSVGLMGLAYRGTRRTGR